MKTYLSLFHVETCLDRVIVAEPTAPVVSEPTASGALVAERERCLAAPGDLGIKGREMTADGMFTLESVACRAAAASGPS